jgi:hypothetical protein
MLLAAILLDALHAALEDAEIALNGVDMDAAAQALFALGVGADGVSFPRFLVSSVPGFLGAWFPRCLAPRQFPRCLGGFLGAWRLGSPCVYAHLQFDGNAASAHLKPPTRQRGGNGSRKGAKAQRGRGGEAAPPILVGRK